MHGRLKRPAQEQIAKSVGIWIRVSTEDQARGESPEVHERRARLYAEAREWNIRETYRLEAVSGKSVMEHPETKRMLADIAAGHITGLIFSKLARLARNTRELLDFADIFRAHGADLISQQESIDTSTPAGRMFYTMIAALSQWEREEISERIAASVPIRAKMGRQIGGQAQFGFEWKDRKLVPHPQEAPVRALMYELFLQERRVKTVARLLNERGYRTRKGDKFNDTTVTRLLTDPLSKGILRQNHTRALGGGRKEAKPKEEWVETPVEAIVSVETWDAVNALFAERKSPGKRPSRKSQHLFAGYAYCSCGQKMYVWSNSPAYVCRPCKSRISCADLEAVYRDRLAAYVLSPEEIAAHGAQADGVLRGKEGLLAAAEAELTRIEADDNRLYELYHASQISQEEFGKRHRPLSARRKELEDEIPRLQASLDVLKIDRASEAVVAADASDLASQWDACSPEEKRKFVEAITRKIVIGRDELAIHLLYDRRHEQGTGSMTMATRMNPDGAHTIALKALGFIATSEGALDRLMDLSGLDRETLRERAGEPEVLASLLDFLLQDEGLLVDFCHDESVDPKDVHLARHLLGGP